VKGFVADVPTFYSGEEMRIELELRDESGVGHVLGVFAHADPGAFSREDPASEYEDVRLRGSGEGQTKATVVISATVGEEVASGEYVCRYVQAYDVRGNYQVIHPRPEICFRVDNDPDDREGPELSDWRFPGHDPGGRRSWWRRLVGGWPGR
jgi:hypothetical protein